MRSKSEIISLLLDPGIIAVVRGKSAEQVLPLAEALLAGGIIAIEITMTTPNAIGAIREASQKFGKSALIGVGTVLDAKTCTEAIAAGAEFVVSPITRPEIAKVANAANKPVMLGAYTPTEAQTAYEGRRGISSKIFPPMALGTHYFKAIARAAAALADCADGRRAFAQRRRIFQGGLLRARRRLLAHHGGNPARIPTGRH